MQNPVEQIAELLDEDANLDRLITRWLENKGPELLLMISPEFASNCINQDPEAYVEYRLDVEKQDCLELRRQYILDNIIFTITGQFTPYDRLHKPLED